MNNIYKFYNLGSDIRIDKFISNNLKNISRSKIKELILNNYVSINNNTIISPKKIIKFKEEVIVNVIENNKYNYTPQNIELKIIYEDNYIIIIDKQSNLVVHPSYGNSNNTLLNGLLYYFPKIRYISKFGIVHRLDKNTTGLIIIAKTELSFNILKRFFMLRKIFKEYDAILTGLLISGGSINAPISRDIKNRKIMSVNFNKGKNAITHYRIIKKFKMHTYVKITIETGRTHQIRVHMSYINHPLVGDFIYSKNCSNFKKSLNYLNNINLIFNRQALHSSKLIFNHPINNKILIFNSKLPEDIKYLLENI